MSVSLQITKKLRSPKLRANECPQDGQRLISYLENETFKIYAKAIHETTHNFQCDNKRLFGDLYRAITNHLFTHGELPKYIAYNFLITHDAESHEANMKFYKKLSGDLWREQLKLNR